MLKWELRDQHHKRRILRTQLSGEWRRVLLWQLRTKFGKGFLYSKLMISRMIGENWLSVIIFLEAKWIFAPCFLIYHPIFVVEIWFLKSTHDSVEFCEISENRWSESVFYVTAYMKFYLHFRHFLPLATNFNRSRGSLIFIQRFRVSWKSFFGEKPYFT